MWIKRADYDTLMQDVGTYRGVNSALKEQVTVQKVTMDWMMVRLTQLEHERAQLLHRYMGVEITTPSIEPAPSRVASGVPIDMGDISFNDMGDDAAKAAGLDWDGNGRLMEHGKVVS